jgi:hypothetical protein
VSQVRVLPGAPIAPYAPVAQLDRALVSGTKGRRFESYRVYHAKFTDIKELQKLFL